MKIVEVSITEDIGFRNAGPASKNEIKLLETSNFPENSKMFHYYGMINLL